MKHTLLATATMGLEAVVGKELKQLGFENIQVENGRVRFEADDEGISRANLWLRTSDRVKLVIGEFKAYTFDELFEKTKALPWADYIAGDAEFPVLGRSVKSTLFSISDCQAIVKKAIVEKLKQKHAITWFEEKGPLSRVEVALHKDTALLTLDTSGEGLHKRGYRPNQNQAPLKETLAAAMIQLANWHSDIPLHDPFCGSGTIPIEAAMMAQNIAPGVNRSFCFEDWMWFPESAHKRMLEEAEDVAKYDEPFDITGSDIDRTMIETARRNAIEAGFPDQIYFKQMQARDFSSKHEKGVLIGNPPYGERMTDKQGVEELYKDIGTMMRNYPHWSVYIITTHEGFEGLYGKKATKKRKLYNGNLKTHYYQYWGEKMPRK
ncbi:THUMP domain-containing class I SAM-dependent RNA methyltransferase [Alkalicoccus halolimnae]|uniref:Class I SAM-dependent RNA methyltransferase n=1 Tax=Alkalicoccus halolimnae TaxID=1667239 RepID=A0A5C7FCP9_9BACI|nr:class I SAM-dependent RNA methyltransferase [Alkalicoccus halolimnae]TXF87260.1 class I SAM-dependent RNA methyltransferase [Alkalicoccus halolimnae]